MFSSFNSLHYYYYKPFITILLPFLFDMFFLLNSLRSQLIVDWPTINQLSSDFPSPQFFNSFLSSLHLLSIDVYNNEFNEIEIFKYVLLFCLLFQ